MEVCLELEQKYKDSLITKFLHHAKKVEADHDIKTDGDNTDYWSSMQLEDGSFVDYNLVEEKNPNQILNIIFDYK